MSLETNANIPTPYVYQPANIAGMMEKKYESDLAEKKLRKKEQDERDKRVAQAKGFQFAQSNNQSMQKLLQDEYNSQTDLFAKMAAAGADITNIGTPEGVAFDQWKRDFTNKALAAKETQAEYDRLMDSYRTAPDKFDQNNIALVVDKFDKAGTIEEKADAINYVRSNPLAFGKQVDVSKGVETTFDAAFPDLELQDLAKSTAEFDKTLQPKTEAVITNYLSTPEAITARQQFDFKKSMGSPDVAQYPDFDTYVRTIATQRAELKKAELTKLRSNLNITNNIGGAASPTGQIISQGRATGARTGLTFSDPNVTYDDATGYVFVPSDKNEQEAQGSAIGNNNVPLIKEGNGYKVRWSDLHNTDAGDEDIMTFTGYDSSSKDVSSQKNLEWTTALKNGKTGDNSTGGLKTIKLDQMGNLWAELGNGDWALLHSPNSTLGATRYTGSNALNVIKTVYGGKVPKKINVHNNQEAQNWLRENYMKLDKTYDIQQ